MYALRKGQIQNEATVLSIFHYPPSYVLSTWITGLNFTPRFWWSFGAEKGKGEPNCSLALLQVICGEDEAFSSQTHKKDKRQWSQVTTRKNSVGFKEKVFHNDTGEQANQKGYGISILGDFQKSTGRDPEQPDLNLNLPCLHKRLD